MLTILPRRGFGITWMTDDGRLYIGRGDDDQWGAWGAHTDESDVLHRAGLTLYVSFSTRGEALAAARSMFDEEDRPSGRLIQLATPYEIVETDLLIITRMGGRWWLEASNPIERLLDGRFASETLAAIIADADALANKAFITRTAALEAASEWIERWGLEGC